MKILIASDLYWPVINGVSTFTRNLAKGLASRGHEVLVIAPSQIGKKYKEVDGNYEIHRTATVIFPFYQNYRISITPYLEVRKIMKEFSPDIVHIQTFLMIGQAVVRYAQKHDIPVVSTNHAMPENLMDNLKTLAPISKPINFALKKYIVRFNTKTDYFTMPTQSALELFGVSKNTFNVPVEAVSNGINLSRFSPSKAPRSIYKKYNLPEKKPIVAFVGRVDAEKHLSTLVKAFSRLLKKLDAHLMIVGDGTDLLNLKELAHDLDIFNSVTFTGRVTDEDLINLHKVGSVFCMPSPAELQSIVILESMASGKPIVAVDAGPLKELCQDGRNGYLCRPDDDKQIAEAFFRILSDKKLSEKMSKESLLIASEHDIEKTFKRFEEIYSSLIDQKKLQ